MVGNQLVLLQFQFLFTFSYITSLSLLPAASLCGLLCVDLRMWNPETVDKKWKRDVKEGVKGGKLS